MVNSGPSEQAFTDQVVQLAMICGWRVCHFRPAKTARGYRTAIQGHKGFPDIVAAKNGRIIFAELKVGRNRPSDDQVEWLAALQCQHASRTEVYVWYPHHWPQIKRIFQEGWRPNGIDD